MRRGFKFELSRSLEEDCRKIIEAEWKNEVHHADSIDGVHSRLLHCSKALSTWSYNTFKQRDNQTKEKNEKLRTLQLQERRWNMGKIRELKEEIHKMFE